MKYHHSLSRRCVRLFLGCLAAMASAASAQSINITAFEDTFVSASNPTSNYGGAGAMSLAGAGLSKGAFESLLKFNLAPAKASFDATFGTGLWQIQSVSLQLTATPPNNGIFNGFGAGPGATNVNFAGLFSIHWMQSDAWVEGTGSPNSPTTNGVSFSTLSSFLSPSDETLGTFSFGGATSGNTVASLGLASAFFADTTAGGTVSLRATPGDAGVAFLFSGRTASNAANRPQLVVNATAIPEPGTIVMLLAGGIAMASRRRRKMGLSEEDEMKTR